MKPSRLPKNETEFLARQADDAKTSIAQTARELGMALREAVDEHPWLAVGLAAATGALVAGEVSRSASDGQKEKPPSTVVDALFDVLRPVFLTVVTTAIAEFVKPRVDSVKTSDTPRTP